MLLLHETFLVKFMSAYLTASPLRRFYLQLGFCELIEELAAKLAMAALDAVKFRETVC
jgi:hypothetical protein